MASRSGARRDLTVADLGDYSVNLCLCRVPPAGAAGFAEVELFLQQERKAHVDGGWRWNCQGGWRDDADADAFGTAACEAAEEIGVACEEWRACLEARLREAYAQRDPCLRSRVYGRGGKAHVSFALLLHPGHAADDRLLRELAPRPVGSAGVAGRTCAESQEATRDLHWARCTSLPADRGVYRGSPCLGFGAMATAPCSLVVERAGCTSGLPGGGSGVQWAAAVVRTDTFAAVPTPADGRTPLARLLAAERRPAPRGARPKQRRPLKLLPRTVVPADAHGCGSAGKGQNNGGGGGNAAPVRIG